MQLRQFSMRTLLLLVAMGALYFPSEKVYRTWLSRNHTFSYVEAVLHSELTEGDSFKSVASHFTSNRLLTHPADTEYISNLSAICSKKGMAIMDKDEFYHLSIGDGSGAYLQFRDKKLVNLWNTAYIDAMKNPSQTRAPAYSMLVFALIYFVVSITVLLIDIVLQRRSRTRNHAMHVRSGNGLKTSGCDSRLSSS